MGSTNICVPSKINWRFLHTKSRGSSVGVATSYTGWTIGVQGFDSRRELGTFFSSVAFRPALGSNQPPIQRVPEAPSPGAKAAGTWSCQSPPSSAEVKHAWCYTFTPMAWCIFKHRDNFTLPLLQQQNLLNNLFFRLQCPWMDHILRYYKL
jgi:hypothetical protein